MSDPCKSRHGGNTASAAAFLAPPKAPSRERVFAQVQAAGSRGITCDEAASQLGMTPNQISGRFTELKAQGRIAPTATYRPTIAGGKAEVCRVLTHVDPV